MEKYRDLFSIEELRRVSLQTKSSAITEEYSYYLFSKNGGELLSLMEKAMVIQLHWQIETFHHHKDVNFREDYAKEKTKSTTQKKSIIDDFLITLGSQISKGVKWLMESFKNYYPQVGCLDIL